jgi:hypothetical protein
LQIAEIGNRWREGVTEDYLSVTILSSWLKTYILRVKRICKRRTASTSAGINTAWVNVCTPTSATVIPASATGTTGGYLSRAAISTNAEDTSRTIGFGTITETSRTSG